jgi:hypothetical protein
MAASTGDHPEYKTSRVNELEEATQTNHGSKAMKAHRMQGDIHHRPASTFARQNNQASVIYSVGLSRFTEGLLIALKSQVEIAARSPKVVKSPSEAAIGVATSKKQLVSVRR